MHEPHGLTTLFVSRNAPYPARSGAPLRCWQNINILAKLGPVHVVSIGAREADVTMPVAASWLHIDRSEYAVASSGWRARVRRIVRPRQFPVENDFVTANINARLLAVIERINPDLIVLSHWQDDLPSSLRARAQIVLDAHNVESSLLLALMGPVALSARGRLRYLNARRVEGRLIRSVDRVWAASDIDAQVFDKMGARHVLVWPNAIDVDSYPDRRRSRGAEAPTLMYLGFFGYPPNAEAAQILIDGIFPVIRAKVPDARLLMVGREPTLGMENAAERDSAITITGEVPNVVPFLERTDVLIVPLKRGSGTRIKILEAFAARIPVVTTAKGIEGIEAIDGVHALIRDTEEELAEATLSTLHDEQATLARVEAAYQLVQERYSWRALSASVYDALGKPPATDGERISADRKISSDAS